MVNLKCPGDFVCVCVCFAFPRGYFPFYFHTQKSLVVACLFPFVWYMSLLCDVFSGTPGAD